MTHKANWFSRFFLGKKPTVNPPESRSDAKSATATEASVATVPPQKSQNELPPELAKDAIVSKDRKVRLAALASVTDQALLAQVAIQDVNQKVRLTAVAKVTDQALLAKVAIESKNPDVREAAVARLTDNVLLAKVAVEEENRRIAVEEESRSSREQETRRIVVEEENRRNLENTFQLIRPDDPRVQSSEQQTRDSIRNILDVAMRTVCEVCNKSRCGPRAVAVIRQSEPAPGNTPCMDRWTLDPADLSKGPSLGRRQVVMGGQKVWVSGICDSCASVKSNVELSELLRKGSGRQANPQDDSRVKAESSYPVTPAIAAKIEDSEAEKDATTILKVVTKYDTSSPHFGAGTRLQYQGRFKEALAAFEAWLVKEPKNTVAWNCKGIALHGLTKYDEAIQCFEEALKILPDDPPTTGNMGRTFHAKGDYQRAADWLEKSLAALPAAGYWSLKGDCLLRLGHPEAALGCFRSARDLDPTKAEYWSNEGATHAQLGSLSDALHCYQKAIDAEANCAAAWFNKADVEESLGRTEAAKDSLEKFIQLSPAGMQRQVESAHKRIQEFAKKPNEQDALPMNSGTDANVPKNETETERLLALAAHSGHTQSQALLGSMLRQRGNINEALPWLRKAADAGDPDAQLDLGMLYVLSSAPYQNYIEAQKVLQKVARSGNRDAKGAALATLSILYADGLGVQHSITKAALLATTAAYSGNKDAVELINNFGPALRQAPPNTILLMQQSIKKLQDRAATDDLNSICSWVMDNLDDLA